MEQDGSLIALALAAFSVPWAAPGDRRAADARGRAARSGARLLGAAAQGRAALHPPHLVIQPRVGAVPFTGSEAADGDRRMARSALEPRPIDALSLAFFSDALFSPPFIRLTEPAVTPTIDLTIHFRTPMPRVADPDPTSCASRAFAPASCTRASSRRTASSGPPTAPCSPSRASSASSCRSRERADGLHSTRVGVVCAPEDSPLNPAAGSRQRGRTFR